MSHLLVEENVCFSSSRTIPQVQNVLRKVADSVDVIVWMSDSQDNCIFINEEVQTLLPHSEVFNLYEWFKFIHPEDVALVRTSFARAKETKEDYQLEYRIIRSNGTTRWMLDSGIPRFSETGTFAGHNGIIVDITKQKIALERLAKKLELEYRLLAENTSDLICHCAPDGTCLYMSPSYTQTLGIEASVAIGRNVCDFIHSDDIGLIRGEIKRQLHTGIAPEVIEIRKRHQDGHYVWMETKIKVLVDPVTKLTTGTLTVSSDITVQRYAREVIRRGGK
mgnify:CR=1 FL=1